MDAAASVVVDAASFHEQSGAGRCIHPVMSLIRPVVMDVAVDELGAVAVADLPGDVNAALRGVHDLAVGQPDVMRTVDELDDLKVDVDGIEHESIPDDVLHG